MEMGSNDIMGEPAENTGDEGQEEAEPDTVARRRMKIAQGFNAVVRELSEMQVQRDKRIWRIKYLTMALAH